MLIGITGGIGSGKSIVSDILILLGVPVYIADVESKKITATSPIVRRKLVNLFGEQLYDGEQLNKPLLASHIFGDKEKLEKVNKIIHPEVLTDFLKWTKKNSDKSILAHEAAILFESGFSKHMDKIITVYAPMELRIERTIKRDKTSREQVISRIQSQIPDEEKVKLSDFVVYNDGSKSLIQQVANIVKQLKELQ